MTCLTDAGSQMPELAALETSEVPAELEPVASEAASVTLSFKQLQQHASDLGVSYRDVMMAVDKKDLRRLIAAHSESSQAQINSVRTAAIRCSAPDDQVTEVVYDVAFNPVSGDWRVVHSVVQDQPGALDLNYVHGLTSIMI